MVVVVRASPGGWVLRGLDATHVLTPWPPPLGGAQCAASCPPCDPAEVAHGLQTLRLPLPPSPPPPTRRHTPAAVLQLVANAGGVRTLVAVMSLHEASDVIQCNGCLALMSLVRGEGEVCQSNQWHVAKAGAIEAIAAAMTRFRCAVVSQGQRGAGLGLRVPAAGRGARIGLGLGVPAAGRGSIRIQKFSIQKARTSRARRLSPRAPALRSWARVGRAP